MIGIGLGLTTLRGGGGGFSPLTLFAGGEAGAWFEPSPDTCFITTFITSTAVTTATVGDPVGFLLDLSQEATASGGVFSGLGPELVDYAQWAPLDPEWTVNGSSLTAVNGTNYGAWQPTALTAGKAYQYTLTVTSYTSGTVTARAGVIGIGATLSGLGSATAVVVANNHEIYIMGNGTFTGTVEISVRELPGNHATQATSAARPTLRASPLHLEDDGIDDVLNWTAAAGNYTIARINSSGTVTIQTSQALSGATDILLESAIAGYVAINRALTPAETTQLTSYLERLA